MAHPRVRPIRSVPSLRVVEYRASHRGQTADSDHSVLPPGLKRAAAGDESPQPLVKSSMIPRCGPRIPLSAELSARAFLVRDAQDQGWSEGRMRGHDLISPFAGVRTVEPVAPEAAYAPLLRDGERFSHLSAARLWGAPTPNSSGEVHVTRPATSRARTAGVIGHRTIGGTTMMRHNLPASDPTTLFLELAPELSVPDLVAIGDHLVLDPRVLDPHDIRPYVSLEELRTGCSAAKGRGVRRARAAAELVRVGAESRRESVLRLLARDAGLPEPVLQHELFDLSGRWIGAFDLAWPEACLIAEYDGDQHRTSTQQYERDIRRFDEAAETRKWPGRDDSAASDGLR